MNDQPSQSPISGPIKPAAPSSHVSNFISALRTFRPLVNEKKEWTGEYEAVPGQVTPNIHQLVNVAFGAVGEMDRFVKDFKTLQAKHAELVADGMHAHVHMEDFGLKVQSMTEGVATLIARYSQALDILATYTGMFFVSLAAVHEHQNSTANYLRSLGSLKADADRAHQGNGAPPPDTDPRS